MRKLQLLNAAIILTGVLCSCSQGSSEQPDIVNDSFEKAQAEIRKVVEQIKIDAESANIEGLQSAHLPSDKFSKFGPRKFERQDVASTNESEALFFGSIKNYKLDLQDLKIDVFGDVGIVTYYPHVSYIQNGEEKVGSGRQTLVFLNTNDGWKIVHEHGTPRAN